MLAFNAAYGVAGEGSMAGTWRRPTILGHGAGETEPSRTVRRPKRTVRKARCYSSRERNLDLQNSAQKIEFSAI